MDVEPEQMKLQKEEVETVQWMPLKECLKKMKDSSWKNCLRNQEMEMLREYLEKETE